MEWTAKPNLFEEGVHRTLRCKKNTKVFQDIWKQRWCSNLAGREYSLHCEKENVIDSLEQSTFDRSQPFAFVKAVSKPLIDCLYTENRHLTSQIPLHVRYSPINVWYRKSVRKFMHCCFTMFLHSVRQSLRWIWAIQTKHTTTIRINRVNNWKADFSRTLYKEIFSFRRTPFPKINKVIRIISFRERPWNWRIQNQFQSAQWNSNHSQIYDGFIDTQGN